VKPVIEADAGNRKIVSGIRDQVLAEPAKRIKVPCRAGECPGVVHAGRADAEGIKSTIVLASG
jgi:hypothetical protein